MTLGFDKQLYILSFDRRGTFQAKMLGWEGTLAAQTAKIAAAKHDGFKAAITDGVRKDKAGILVDEQFAADGLDRREECEKIVAAARRTAATKWNTRAFEKAHAT